MPFTISPAWNPIQQRDQCRSYIEANLVKSGLEGNSFSILPIAAIKALATYSNIRLVIDKDPHLPSLPEHSRDHLADKIHKFCPRQFAACMYAETSMRLLRDLWNHSFADDKLPVPENSKNVPGLPNEYVNFCNIQYKFCAPVLTLGDFDQEGAKMRMVPWIHMTDKGNQGQYTVSFHRGHIVQNKGDDPESYTGSLDFQCVSFQSKQVAEQYEILSEGKFGFMCHGSYYFLYT